MQRSVAPGMSWTYRQAACSRVAMAVPKGRGCGVVVNYRVADAQVALAPLPMLCLEAMVSRFVWMPAFRLLNLLQGFPRWRRTHGIYSLLLYLPDRTQSFQSGRGCYTRHPFSSRPWRRCHKGSCPGRYTVWDTADPIIWGDKHTTRAGRQHRIGFGADGMQGGAFPCPPTNTVFRTVRRVVRTDDLFGCGG